MARYETQFEKTFGGVNYKFHADITVGTNSVCMQRGSYDYPEVWETDYEIEIDFLGVFVDETNEFEEVILFFPKSFVADIKSEIKAEFTEHSSKFVRI